AATPLAVNESINPDQVAVSVDQRPAAIAGIDWSVGLHVDHGVIKLGLPSQCADNPFGDCMVETSGRPNCQNRLSQTGSILFLKWNDGQSVSFDFDQGQIGKALHANQLRIKRTLLMKQTCLTGDKFHLQRSHYNLDALSTRDHVCVSDDVATGIDNHARSDSALP